MDYIHIYNLHILERENEVNYYTSLISTMTFNKINTKYHTHYD